MRVHVCAVRMTLHRADVLEAYLNGQDNIQKATVYERTGDVVLTYRGSRKDAAALLAAYRFDNEELEVLVTSHDSRKINQEYQEKMVSLVAGRVFRKVFLPAPIAAAYTVWRSIAFVWKGIRCLLHRKLEVEVLDALSITVPSIDGKVEYTVPEGTQSGTTFRLRGKGIQYLNGRGRGDMYVKCEVEIPKKLNKTQREALKKFEGTLKEENYEKRKGFFKKLKDMFNS